MDFSTIDIATLTRSVTGKGERYLELFLREYTALFPGPVNPGCPRCLNQYLTQYKKHLKAMQKTCRYRLHPKYENIPLEFGSPILVNNDNLTDDYALKLLEHPNGVLYFAQMPQPGCAPVEDDHNPPADVPHPAYDPNNLDGLEGCGDENFDLEENE